MLSLETHLEGIGCLHRSIHGYLSGLQVGGNQSWSHILSIFFTRYCLTIEHQMEFEKLIRWCRQQSTGLSLFILIFWGYGGMKYCSIYFQSGLPITFLLGFYVSLVVKRWWEQWSKLPWPDTIAIYLKGRWASTTPLQTPNKVSTANHLPNCLILTFISQQAIKSSAWYKCCRLAGRIPWSRESQSKDDEEDGD